MKWCLFGSAAVLLATFCHAKEDAFTYRLAARHEECFYFDAIQGESIELEFQVVSGGALDVDYTLANPSGHIIERKSRVQDHLYEATASQTGDHRICLGNLFSTMTAKEVFVLIMTNGGDDDEDDEDQISRMGGLAGSLGEQMSLNAGMAPEDSEVGRVEKSGHNIHRKLYKVTTLQDHLRARENRHRKTAKSNLYRVSIMSGIQCIVIMGVGFLQIVMIRGLFGDKGGTGRGGGGGGGMARSSGGF